MVRFLLGETEDVMARWRPHAASYIGRHLAATLWAAYGGIAWAFHARYPQHEWLGAAALSVLAAAHAAAVYLLARRGAAAAAAVAAASLAAAASIAAHTAVLRDHPMYVAPTLGLLVALLGLARNELERLRSVHHLTNRRLVVRGGAGRLTERSVDLERVDSVQAIQGGLGQLFRFATLTLVMEAKGRRKEGAPPPALELRGVPRWEDVKHGLEMALDEQRLSPKERQRRSEDRRLKDAMRALAQWVRHEAA